MRALSLYGAAKSNCCVLESAPAESLLHSLGLRQGVEVSVVSRQPFGGPIVVRLGRRCLAISKDIAEQINIRELT